MKNTFSFERMKKAFSHGVIPAIIGFGSNHPFGNAYYQDDVIILSYNDMYTSQNGVSPAYYYSLEIQKFLANRQTANASNGNIYSLPKDSVIKYGIALFINSCNKL
jgi:hypothetical protein